jgi:hypothetical protein
LALALLLAAPCEHPRLGGLDEGQRVAACELLARPTSAPLASRRGLDEVYQRPGFERARARNAGAWQAWLAQLRVWLQSIFESSGAETYSELARISVLALALVVSAGVTLRFLRSRRPAAAGGGPLPAVPPLELDEPGAHLARAAAALPGAPREAIREGQLALLAALERRRLARPDRVKTNREVVAELETLGASAELVAQVRPLFEWFDRTFYALTPVDEAEARRFLARVREVAG